ncbi:bifunctional 4-hydroxy-2-oxoglutarate aldolase/2-dehydro-3-deoxy-phosphogluconate aldolase [Paracoccus sanguinis]|uniref:bifunctional 4-hydroxy-2-oxoglutarate aldolase/2-dehydro-3-deoxy-phosphogluconate aldolase n=1 Tax=Paracoccus sanguinis TaxID=1545044 RepID=UPI00051FB4A6|nr:bifunctional 4-hydroxy-2-oxoglutarate aldolase/2-dehydro-3-deoxy-phosphogluconate aldolase [Paracoccus sanguinis]KGJ17431.1 keto-deoxy-phosphogluconate aldolase [Paracoccus sanguinis]
MTPDRQSARMREICALAPVVPVIVIHDAAHAAPLARALVAGGLPVLEVTLRTPAALDAIRAMAQVEGAVVGAGTVLSPDDIHRARSAGATFAVSPGLTDTLIAPCESCALPLLPGAATASEAMQALEAGYHMLKFFPAGPAGGPAYLKALGGPLPGIAFCPTGGVSAENARDYLSLPNVVCIGGSWVAPEAMMRAGDWAGIEALARAAAGLAQ